MLPAGSLNRVLTIEALTPGSDAWGEPSTVWTAFATVRANIKAPSGLASAERVAADQQVSVTTYSARIRYRTDITAAMRAALDDGRLCNIAQVIPDVEHREHTDLVLITGAEV